MFISEEIVNREQSGLGVTEERCNPDAALTNRLISQMVKLADIQEPETFDFDSQVHQQ